MSLGAAEPDLSGEVLRPAPRAKRWAGRDAPGQTREVRRPSTRRRLVDQLDTPPTVRGVARGNEYDSNPLTAESYLSLPEVEALAAAGPRALRDPKALMHFLGRTLLTMRGFHSQIQQLHRDVQQARLVRERAGQATTLSPLDAVRFLTPEQLEPIMDAAIRERLAALEQATAGAERVQRDARRELNRVRFAVTGLLEDAQMTEALRTRLVQLLRSFPEQGAAPSPQGREAPHRALQSTASATSAAATDDATSGGTASREGQASDTTNSTAGGEGADETAPAPRDAPGASGGTDHEGAASLTDLFA